MTRLQKKCYFAAAGFHLLLLVILLVGPAFLTSRAAPDDLPVLEFIPLKATDLPFSNAGGSPTAALPKPTPPTPEPPPAEPPKPEPEKTILQKILEPTPPEPTEKPEVQSLEKRGVIKPQDPALTPTKEKNKIEVSNKIVKRSAPTAKTHKPDGDTSEAEARAERTAAATANKQRADAIRRLANNVRTGLSSSTSVTMPGPGGEAYANYAQIVKSKYTQEWIAPDDMADDSATAKVSVTIARDGTVVEAHVTRESGSAATDRSVREVLNRVKYILPFPDGAKDDQRTFIINFNLKAKKLLG